MKPLFAPLLAMTLFAMPVMALAFSLGNKPYVQPVEGEPAAEVSIDPDVGIVGALNFNEDGCYIGRTGAETLRVHAQRKVHMDAKIRIARETCTVTFVFTPQDGHQYRVYPGLEPSRGGQCSMALMGKGPDGANEAVDVQPFEMRVRGFGCLRASE
ncbi:hypothetical protein [Stenotrophomonas sp. Iso1]|uniref:hypothetical protein n=1 Tax=Stenotrophomonas sp. Iso1 TaxID=2977283 RepID=UPI0022B7CD6E|nr:hypothetical protein [Stenotrophomonas sp. Iso1]